MSDEEKEYDPSEPDYPADKPTGPGDVLKKFGLSESDMKEFERVAGAQKKGRDEFDDWNRANFQDPKFTVKFGVTAKLEGIAATQMAFFNFVFVRSGTVTIDKFTKSIIHLGLAALWEIHRQGSATQEMMRHCAQMDPELAARFMFHSAVHGARMHKQMMEEQYREMAHDFRDLTDKKEL